jgi:hypothetical protein
MLGFAVAEPDLHIAVLFEIKKLDAFWEWGMGNGEWKEGSEKFLLVVNNP